MASILLLDCDPVLSTATGDHLRRDGHDVQPVPDGSVALEVARRAPPQLVILDPLLPGSGGLDFIRALRGSADHRLRSVPVLIVSALADEADTAAGLEAGADDYLPKPFAMRELRARVKALLRRTERAVQAAGASGAVIPLRIGDLELDPAARTLRRRGRDVPLNPREFDLLLFLVRHTGQVFSREQLLDAVWTAGAGPYAGDIRTVDVHVRWLREKIERKPSRPEVLETVRGVGYRVRHAERSGARHLRLAG